MTTANGNVIGLTQIFGTAPRSTGFNVLLMADGFTANQQGAFNTACERFRHTFLAAAPFDQLAAKINIFRLNVASLESGVSDNRHHIDIRRTYFDCLFDAGAEWVLICNESHALATAAQALPEYRALMVVSNTPIYGGSGRPGVANYSLDPKAELIALHEMGHSAFGLADEYGSPQGAFDSSSGASPAGEPSEPNVTRITDRATLTALKWGAAVTTAVLPIMRNPDCSKENPKSSKFAPGTVGLFEGARYFHCGVYRPEYDCRMRTLAQPFCAVCRQVIVQKLASLGA